MRSCKDCTKCCEGYLSGETKGYSFYKGKPCHFLEIGKGCSIYKDRPESPCRMFKCEWLTSPEIPLWMKPNEVNAILSVRNTPNGIAYLSVAEAGSRLDSRVLSWVIEYALKNKINVTWTVDGGRHWLGTPEFSKEAEGL